MFMLKQVVNLTTYSDRKCYWECARLYGMNEFFNLSVPVGDSSNVFRAGKSVYNVDVMLVGQQIVQ